MKWLRRLVVIALAVPASVVALESARPAVHAVDLGPTSVWIERTLASATAVPASTVWIDLLVDSGEMVHAGQKLAVQLNAQGRVVQEYTASTAGRVAIVEKQVRGESPGTVLEIHVGDTPPCTGGECELTSVR